MVYQGRILDCDCRQGTLCFNSARHRRLVEVDDVGRWLVQWCCICWLVMNRKAWWVICWRSLSCYHFAGHLSTIIVINLVNFGGEHVAIKVFVLELPLNVAKWTLWLDLGDRLLHSLIGLLLDRYRILPVKLTLLIVDEVCHVLCSLFTDLINILHKLLLLFFDHSKNLLDPTLHLGS